MKYLIHGYFSKEDLGRLKLLKLVTAENNALSRFIFLQDDLGAFLTERTSANLLCFL